MARHIYGYTKVFDGDSDPELKDYYVNNRIIEQQPNVVYVNRNIPPQPNVVYVNQQQYPNV